MPEDYYIIFILNQSKESQYFKQLQVLESEIAIYNHSILTKQFCLMKNYSDI